MGKTQKSYSPTLLILVLFDLVTRPTFITVGPIGPKKKLKRHISIKTCMEHWFWVQFAI